jgi:hypothetical protein
VKDITAWMLTRLDLNAIPVPDRDNLAAVEEAVLDELDPPLNLQGHGHHSTAHTTG